MKRLSAAIGTLLIISAPALAVAGDQAPPAPKPGMATMAPMPPPGNDKGRWHLMPPPGPRPAGPEFAMRLAERLAAAETLIGIKSNQLDAWRTYTSALIDLLMPSPPPPPPAAPPGNGGADRAFAHQEQMARRMKEQAAKADTLLDAITALRTKLTPQQLDRLSTINVLPLPPMRGPGPEGRGPMDFRMGKGPMGRGEWNRGSGPHGPDAGGPADHGPMMSGPADEDGLDPAGPAAMPDGGPDGPVPMMVEPDAVPAAPDAAPPAPAQ